MDKKNKTELEKLTDLHKRIESLNYLYYKVTKVDSLFSSDDIMSYALEKSKGDIDIYLGYSKTILKNRVIDFVRHYVSRIEYKIKFYNMVIVPMLNYEFKVYDVELLEILTNRYTIKYNVCLKMENYKMASGRLNSRKIDKVYKEFLQENNLNESEFIQKFEKGLVKFEEMFNDNLEYNENIESEEF